MHASPTYQAQRVSAAIGRQGGVTGLLRPAFLWASWWRFTALVAHLRWAGIASLVWGRPLMQALIEALN
jgi:hypothetical protein